MVTVHFTVPMADVVHIVPSQVAVGSYSNPDDLLGVAHLLEHLLLLYGTEKYPD